MSRSRPVLPDDPTRVEGGPVRGGSSSRPIGIGGGPSRSPINSGGGASLLADGDEESGNAAQHKAAAEPLPENERGFGRFTLLRRLAYGGMGEIFLARQGGAGSLSPVSKLVVIKRILSHMKRDEKHRRMFLDEARLQALLNNQHVVQIHDMGEENGHVFLAMEHVHGPSWRALIDRCRKNREWIPVAHVCAMVSQAAQGLSYAHNLVDVTGSPLKIVHRDINPHNVLVTYDGEVKIIDFGIAKSELADGQTETGTIKGKFSYMSPEQSAAEPLDRRSDIFALGICLYELLTLENPFRRGNVVLSLEAIQKDEPAPLAKKRREAAALQAIVDKCLAKRARDRFNDCGELAVALDAVLANGVVDQPDTGLAPWLRQRFADEIAEHLHILEKTGSTNAVVARGSDPSSLPRRRPVTSKPPEQPISADDDELPTESAGDDHVDPAMPTAQFEAPDVAQERTSSTPPPYASGLQPAEPASDVSNVFDVHSIAEEVEPAAKKSRVPILFAAIGVVVVALAIGVAAVCYAQPQEASTLWTALQLRAGLKDAPEVKLAPVAPLVPVVTPPIAVVPPPIAVVTPPPVDETPPPTPATTTTTATTKPDEPSAKVAHKSTASTSTVHDKPIEKAEKAEKAVVAKLTVTSEGYEVRGGRSVFAGEATTLSVDHNSGAPFSVKLRVRADDNGATVDVDTDPWAIVRVDGLGKGRSPQKGIAIAFGKSASIELANPTGGKMTLSLKAAH